MLIKRRVRKVYKQLPPHTNEAFSLTNEGKANKAFIIVVIVVVALIGLTLLLFFSDALVGEAIRGLPLCGNSVLDKSEKCDDGNKDNWDGCSSACKIESGWSCDLPTASGAVKVPSKCKQLVSLTKTKEIENR